MTTSQTDITAQRGITIIVCIKRTPHSSTHVRIATTRASGRPRCIHTDGVDFTFSPFDEIALAAAVDLKQGRAGSEVIAVSVGSSESSTILRSALAMGADQAVLLKTDTEPGMQLDGYQVAYALSQWVHTVPFDILLFGSQSFDENSGQVGPMVARLLTVPVVSSVHKIIHTGNQLEIHLLDGGEIVKLETAMPVAITVSKGLAEPKHPSVRDILQAKAKMLQTIHADLPSPSIEVIELRSPPRRESITMLPEGTSAAPELLRLLRDRGALPS